MNKKDLSSWVSCNRCLWIYDETFVARCPKCGLDARTKARKLYSTKADVYRYTQTPWRQTKMREFQRKLGEEININKQSIAAQKRARRQRLGLKSIYD